ncbi:hypothetical protein SAMN04487949_0352 [Halogranum gelatinilyticum]|uniref:Major facilitator superfamily (MFS) profile domain-containing protein n=1 Tax=Halogranum gelatinilyticum TaxID=660521 RepID=A0A1G9PEC8_9EURY|nr:hypothetical protein [Halogranum gelatinilyticum]SDL97109.1 hypothetical protein SAMN04487949_0352 [Halogranum gelatinilyticum]
MTGRYGDRDYHRLTKGGVAVGVSLFALGSLCEAAAAAMFGGVAGWTLAFLVELELLGVALAFAAPFLFGIVLPLTE